MSWLIQTCAPVSFTSCFIASMLRRLAAGSKRVPTTKVARAVTGLVAQQQCCGPLQLTVGDVAVVAQSHLGHTGGATAIGEQPVKNSPHPVRVYRLPVASAGPVQPDGLAGLAGRSDVAVAGVPAPWGADLAHLLPDPFLDRPLSPPPPPPPIAAGPIRVLKSRPTAAGLRTPGSIRRTSRAT